ncbi:unnamed protein product [Arabidopsis lyrata]|uniref:Uncharacterized protein n=1 Tax=Arabidopsis lyrata subsp. lyrata TaxID=81972 RepID=D7M8D1_ARALL|nr:uncharacterized protein LOC9308453 [Arabidopsis lyrata subsp. lyrata]EFH48643.1 hypothetical protein ARALYDRAFT_489738 [Arabidopsis lyrata subsp. lyrata]CAH8272669.1 unnamed protein product [Arabidopsis lyrata]|eukprot:XP_020877525.1 uncharacterized protein LOC9308453 [Arabidopsis lyrata subsp. lyrata]
MRGVGGPLLSIGDLLADLGEETGDSPENNPNPDNSSKSDSNDAISGPLDLTRLFQENYDKLNDAFAGSDHSWTSLTLELCTSLETANKLVHATTTNARLLSEKVEELEKIVKRGDSAVAAARTVHATVNQKGLPSA